MKTSSLAVLVWFILYYYCSLLFAGAQHTDPTEVDALKKIKMALGDPYGNLKNWGKGDPCNVPWTGVLCYNATNAEGYFHVEKLELLNMNLTGYLAPEIGILQDLKILDFMWNNISGSIPKEIGNITTLELLLLSGNQLSGTLPEELGYLPNLDRLQIDQNKISGSIPKSFANMNKTKHLHMNNNSLSGQIPKELSKLPILVHLLLDNNNLTSELPSELANIPNLLILQLDNNPFTNSAIPHSYVNMRKLLKLSLRNCSLQGSIPDFSTIPALGYLDLSYNGLMGNIPSQKLSSNITTINLSHNKLKGSIPSSFSGLPFLQKLSLDNNRLTGSAPSDIGLSMSFLSTAKLLLDFRNNGLSNLNNITHLANQPPNITLRLDGNPVCSQVTIPGISKLCSTENGSEDTSGCSNNSNLACNPSSCVPHHYEYIPNSGCFCAAPMEVGYRLKSPGFSFFPPYIKMFEDYLTSELNLHLYQLSIASYSWLPGPRLTMNLKIFPPINQSVRELNKSEILRIRNRFGGWKFHKSDIFGPYELINITLEEQYETVYLYSGEAGLSKGSLAGILIGTILGTAVVSSIILMMILKRQEKYTKTTSRKKLLEKKRVKVEGVKDFKYEEIALATNNFSDSMVIGQGGYGKVYKGHLNDGTVVAIKRARGGSLQGEREFSTEIELLSRLHHRNLVSLLGYCDDHDEQSIFILVKLA